MKVHIFPVLYKTCFLLRQIIDLNVIAYFWEKNTLTDMSLLNLENGIFSFTIKINYIESSKGSFINIDYQKGISKIPIIKQNRLKKMDKIVIRVHGSFSLKRESILYYQKNYILRAVQNYYRWR